MEIMPPVVPCCRRKSSRTRTGRELVADTNDEKIRQDMRGLVRDKGQEVTVQIGESPWYTALECTTPSSLLSNAPNHGLYSSCYGQTDVELSDEYLSSRHAIQ